MTVTAAPSTPSRVRLGMLVQDGGSSKMSGIVVWVSPEHSHAVYQTSEGSYFAQTVEGLTPAPAGSAADLMAGKATADSTDPHGLAAAMNAVGAASKAINAVDCEEKSPTWEETRNELYDRSTDIYEELGTLLIEMSLYCREGVITGNEPHDAGIALSKLVPVHAHRRKTLPGKVPAAVVSK